jgi:formate dehydrogenase major subunit
VDLEGNPRNPKRALLKWDAAGKKWVGDIPDGPAPPMGDKGVYPFIMKPDGLLALFGPGLKDGPFPEHYEPLECPIEKNLMSGQMINPAIKLFKEGMDKFASCDPKYPFVCSTYRVTEHWQTGVLTRWLPWLIEAEPQLFVEMSLELGKLKGIKNGERVMVSTHRGQVEAVAIVTNRLKPFQVAGQTIHQVGIPYHFGWLHPKKGGDSANLLTPTVGDPNTMIPESKAFMANVAKLTKQPVPKAGKKA